MLQGTGQTAVAVAKADDEVELVAAGACVDDVVNTIELEDDTEETGAFVEVVLWILEVLGNDEVATRLEDVN